MNTVFKRYFFVVVCIISMVGCDDSTRDTHKITSDEALLLDRDTIITIDSVMGQPIRAVFRKPDGIGPFPAIVVLHGCGGLWKNDNISEGVMESHFEDWSDLLKSQGIVGLFVDSYSARNIAEFCNVAPPQDSIASPNFERPKDAYAALDFLRRVKCVNDGKVALLGFSHGGATALATMYDTDLQHNGNWQVSSNGTSFIVPGPQQRPDIGGFVAAVAYYPGCGFYGYFGSPSDSLSGKYRPYAPTMILHAGMDPLYTSGYPDILLGKARQSSKNNNVASNLSMYVYASASHSFDGADTGVDKTSSDSARIKAIQWFNVHLK